LCGGIYPDPGFGPAGRAAFPIAELGAPPAPNFHHLRSHQANLIDATYSEDLTITPAGQAGPLAVIDATGNARYRNGCSQSFGGKAADYGGLIDGAWNINNRDCKPVGTVGMSATAISDVTGRLFPLRVGNEAAYSVSYSSGATTVIRQMRAEVVGRKDHFFLRDGQDAGEVYFIRSGVIDPSTNAWIRVTEFTYSTRLNWEVGALADSGWNEEFISWD